MENKTQDYQSEILAIIRGNTSPGVMRNKLEDYHENDLADVFSELTAAERRKVCRILNLEPFPNSLVSKPVPQTPKSGQ